MVISAGKNAYIFRRMAYLALAATCLLSGCDPNAPDADEKETAQSEKAARKDVSAPVVAPEPMARNDTLKANCLIQSRQSVKIKAEAGGRIEAVGVTLGQSVKRGTLLAKIRSQDQQFEIERLGIAMAQYKEREALLEVQLSQAQAAWGAARQLYSGPDVAQPALALREKNAELKLNLMEQESLKVQLKKLRSQVVQSMVTSPIDGMVVAKNAEVGMVVSPGGLGLNGSDLLFEVADMEKLQAECGARESDALRIKKGQRFTLKLDGSRNIVIDAEIVRVAPVIMNDTGNSTFLFWGEFSKPNDINVIPGMHAYASLSIDG